MKHTFLSAVFLLFSVGVTQAQNSVHAAGGEASSIDGTVSYSVGQVVYHTYSGHNGSVAQGVQQPYEITTISGIDIPEIALELSAYPNPTTDVLHLSIGNYSNEALSYQLYDVRGKLLAQEKISGASTTIDMIPYSMAMYYLNITENDQPIKTFKILKN